MPVWCPWGFSRSWGVLVEERYALPEIARVQMRDAAVGRLLELRAAGRLTAGPLLLGNRPTAIRGPVLQPVLHGLPVPEGKAKARGA